MGPELIERHQEHTSTPDVPERVTLTIVGATAAIVSVVAALTNLFG